MATAATNKVLPEVLLSRASESHNGTWGKLTCKEVSIDLHCMERLWLGNAKGASCIPAGRYLVQATQSYKFRRIMYLVQSVPSRSGIRIHSANWPEELQGCVALGTSTTLTAKGKMLLNSRAAVKKFETALGFKDFYLTVVDVPKQA